MGFALHYNNRYHSIYCSYARHQSSAFYSFACHPSSHPIPWHQTCQGVQELYTAAIRSDLRQHEMIWTFSSILRSVLCQRRARSRFTGWSIGSEVTMTKMWQPFQRREFHHSWESLNVAIREIKLWSLFGSTGCVRDVFLLILTLP